MQRGPLAPAIDAYKEAIRSGAIAGDRYCTSLARHRLVVMYHRCAKLKKADRLIAAYLADEKSMNQKSGSLNLIHAELLYERNYLTKAAEQIEKSIQLCLYQHHAAAIPYCQMISAKIRFAQGDLKGAEHKTRESMQ